ncbi:MULTISPECIES: tyrosine-type recombinase/integrase [unclassified Pseudoalteromonas]|uniref:tyrosine-type recombinase/integrase n=1 Tax=unclassified Pseudoalteromonas TaxID=194690 RepID=UPI0016045F3C|nr:MULTISPECIES: tyrosine-type recombinase/integrase [unclassified Pseudoalteromonas]MBB1295469.1 tyrosine-type recombinase/integrase [Pseudoalteromonas sp. SR41-4]MBB1410255.1 tyrosine-type recombinase/integrase [Pseudoalteromonas sp. SG44-17]MBB1417425.1 tyrosine-type recombinase/integrase [Pseudoalteromonas sp. SG44-1]
MTRFAKELFEIRHDLVAANSMYKKTVIYKDVKCPIYNYILSLNSEASKETAARVLKAVAKHIGRDSIYDINWQNFNATALNTLINSFKSNENYSPKTITLYIAIVKQVVEHAYLLGKMSALQRDAIKMVKPKTGSRNKEYNLLDHHGVESLLGMISKKTCENASKIRDYAIFSVLLRCGLRRQEIVNLKIGDVGDKALRVIGKGNKERKVALHPVVLEAINTWLDIHLYSNKDEPLFVRILKGGHLQKKTMSADAIFKLCCKYEAPPPHSLRRSYATNLYNRGVPIKKISLLLGHNQVSTTELYVRVNDEDLYQEVIDNLL